MASLRKIPDKVIAKLKSIKSASISVAAVIEVSQKQIDDLNLERAGVQIKNDLLEVPKDAIFPNQEFGYVSRDNFEGHEFVDRDSPRVSKQIYLGERPIYGDWTNGTFDLWQTRNVFRRVLIPPMGFTLQFSNQGYDDKKKKWKLVATIEPSIERNDPEFESNLLFALSLLREVTGTCDIFESGSTAKEIASTRIVSWDIFPPGERDLKCELARKIANKPDEAKKIILDRAGTIESLKPAQYIVGSGLASNYYGALFAEDLVVFENLDYGNATYVLYENWENLSKLSRTQLLNGQENFDRVIHGNNWKKTLTEIVKHELRFRKKNSRRTLFST